MEEALKLLGGKFQPLVNLSKLHFEKEELKGRGDFKTCNNKKNEYKALLPILPKKCFIITNQCAAHTFVVMQIICIFISVVIKYPKDPQITQYQKKDLFYATLVMSKHLDNFLLNHLINAIWRCLSES